MRQQAWNEVKIALIDYPKCEWYINQIRQEKLYPYKPTDVNDDISSGSFSPDGISNRVISIQEDVTYNRLVFQRDTIKRKLDASPAWVSELVALMYFGEDELKLTPACQLLGINWRTGKKAYETFMEELAKDLGILTF